MSMLIILNQIVGHTLTKTVKNVSGKNNQIVF